MRAHHPHVHMVCYSTNPSDGFLTKKGIEKMKSGLVKNIFKNNLREIYAEQTQRRDWLKNESRGAMLKLIRKMKSGNVENSKIEELFLHLSERLKTTTGKKVYGYLQPSLKAIVDELIDELSKEEVVSKAYEIWYEMREEVIHSYMDELPDRILLSEQKEFKSIKNMIISEADQFSIESLDFDDLDVAEAEALYDEISEPHEFGMVEEFNALDYEQDDKQSNNVRNEDTQDAYVDWTDEYKKAREYLFGANEILQDFEEARIRLTAEADKGNILAIYDLGRIYSSGLGVDKNLGVANDYYKKAYDGFIELESQRPWKYTEYRIGKMLAARSWYRAGLSKCNRVVRIIIREKI